MSDMITATALTKTWPGGGGLAPLDLDIPAGRLTVLRGRSGSGKSTLLAILAGWSEPSGGLLVRDPGADPVSWAGTAIVPQSLALIPELTVQENVEAPLRLAGLPVERDAVRALLERLDVGQFLRRLPGELSLGQRQRVAIARALVRPASVVLVDEPTSHQDADHAAEIVAELVAVARTGAAVLAATHDGRVIDAADLVIDLDHAHP